uniref:Rho GTPase-activating protein 29 n=1 Tax=Naja naja TaxID=35670 RepID=A0A8C6VKG0_NAJNA
MLRQNSDSNKRGLGLTKLSTSNFFPISNTGNKGMGRNTKSSSLNSISSNFDGYDNIIVDPDYIMRLVNDVRKFADVLLHLREAITSENQNCLHRFVHERLGEVLRVLKAIINKHPNLNSVDVLSAAGTVIAKVRAVNFKEINEEKREVLSEIFSSIDLLAFTFGSAVSDCLMGDVDNGSGLGHQVSRQSQSFEKLCRDSGVSLHEGGQSTGHLNAEEIDSILLRNDNGIKSALSYAKAWSKYAKDIMVWVEKKINLEMECAKNLAKVAETTKTIIVSQDYMPFQSIFMNAFQNDIESSLLWQQAAVALQTNKFLQPLLGRKNELDRQRKEIKELWQREEKKMQELESSVRKAKQLYLQRQEEYEKARSTTLRAEDDYITSNWGFTKDTSKIEKKRKLEEEALQKAEEANEHFKTSKAEVEEKRNNLENFKSVILTQLREQIYQCDLTLKAATVNLFQIQHTQCVSMPVNCQLLCELTKLYDPGKKLFEYVKNLPKYDVPTESVCFETQTSQIGGVFGEQSDNVPASQMCIPQCSGDYPIQLLDDTTSPAYLCSQKIGDNRSLSSTDVSAVRGLPPFRSWSVGNQSWGMCSDSESAGGSSESRSVDSPSASPVGDFKRLPRTPSIGTMSSADDLDEREAPSPDCGLNDLAVEIASTPGPFRNTLLSKAAQTHKLRKLRSPSKCRECDSLVVFHGAECEECSLSCHKKCLETLAIQCGHKKLHGKLHLFGVEFTQVSKNSEDGIPFIIRKCTSEIESRALNVKGIYRVNGAKSRVEKLCQSFENGKDLVELSELNAHDISNVLKLFLRQLPEPLILSRFYNEFIGLAKESQNINEELDRKQMRPKLNKQQPVCIELNRIILKIKDLLKLLPTANRNTLQFLLAHLRRVSKQSDENKMSACNLGIIFGPTLIRPRETDATLSLSSLVDYPYQARMVELLITHYEKIFDTAQEHSSAAAESDETSFCIKSSLSVEDKQASQERKGGHLVAVKDSVKRKNSTKRSISFEEPDGSKRSPFQSDSSVKDNKATPVSDQDNGKDDLETEDGVKSDQFIRPKHQIIQVQKCSQKSKPFLRPVSLPLGPKLPSCILNEQNLQNASLNPDLALENDTVPIKKSDNKATPVSDQDNGKDDLETEDGVKSDQFIRPKHQINQVQMRCQKSKPFLRPVGPKLPSCILNEQNLQNASLNPDLALENDTVPIKKSDNKATPVSDQDNGKDDLETEDGVKSDQFIRPKHQINQVQMRCQKSKPFLRPVGPKLPSCILNEQNLQNASLNPDLALENDTVPIKKSDNKATPVSDQENGKDDLETEDGVKSDQFIPKHQIIHVQMCSQKSKPFLRPVGPKLPSCILNKQNLQNASLNPDLALENDTVPIKKSDNKATPVSDQDNGKDDLETEDGVKSDQFIRPKHQINQVQMRCQKSKPFLRPVSLPLGPKLPSCILNEQNLQNASLNPDKLGESLVIEDISETPTLPSINAGSRISCYDPQTQKTTWDKQYKQYDITAKTAKIMTNIHENLTQESVNTCALNTSDNFVNNSTNALLFCKPYTGPITTVREASTPVVSLKKPRCFQPPGETFYKPSANNNAKPNGESSAPKCCAAIIHNDMPGLGVNPDLDDGCLDSSSQHRKVDSSSQHRKEQKYGFETPTPADLKPAYQGLRPKRMQELENREAHFV